MPNTTGNPLLQFIVPYAIIFVIFYLLVFRPRKKEQEERKNLLTSLKKNDDVITTGGVHGTVVNVKEKTVIIRIDDAAKMEIDKEAITTVVKHGEAVITK